MNNTEIYFARQNFLWNIGLYILIGVIAFYIIAYIYASIRTWFDRHFRKNCYKCKYWKLSNVSGAGGICYYKCQKNCLKQEIMQEFNDNEYYTKCKQFKEGDK